MGYLTANSSVKLIRRTLASTRPLLARASEKHETFQIFRKKAFFDDLNFIHFWSLFEAAKNKKDSPSGLPNKQELIEDRRWRQHQFATREELHETLEVEEKGFYPFKSRWKTDPRAGWETETIPISGAGAFPISYSVNSYTDLNLHQIINHTMFAKLKVCHFFLKF